MEEIGEKPAVATWNLGNYLNIRLTTDEKARNPTAVEMTGQSQDRPVA